MEPEALDYAGALTRLTAMVGRHVEVTVRGAYVSAPFFLDLEGVLQRTDQVEDPEAIGWHSEAVRQVEIDLHY